MNNKNGFWLVICILMNCYSFAYASDSTNVTFPQLTSAPAKPFVLATGTRTGASNCENYCNKGEISKTTCPAGFSPFVMTAPTHTDVPEGHSFPQMCEKHMRNLTARGKVAVNSTGGYDLWLATKVETDSSCYDAGVEVNFVIYCEKNLAA